MNSFLETKWHTLDPQEIFKILETTKTGLADKEAKDRLIKKGLNKLPEAKPESIALIFLRQFESPLIYILLAASLAVFIMGERVDSIIIASVLLFNAIIGAVQEGRARNTLVALKKFVETNAVVLRDGKEIIIPDTEVVVGDVVILQEGDKIAADSRIIISHDIKIDESALTGESEAVYKIDGILKKPDLFVQEEKNMAFKGTHIVSGYGQAVVVRTGADTVIGQIATEVATVDTEIPLKTNIRYLSRIIITVAVSSSTFLFIFGVLSGRTAQEMFATAISITVSIIPEGLPAAITVILASGVWRMSKRNALVKRLQAVEALGQAQVIAVDKTGTLTRNEMVVQTIFVDNKIFEVTGVGYEPKGKVLIERETIESLSDYPELMLTGKISALSTNAQIMFLEETKEWKISGDPTEAAISVLAKKLGFDKNQLEEKFSPIAEIPFDYNLKYHASLHKDNSVGDLITVIGAPEIILAASNKVWHNQEEKHLSQEEREALESTFSDISRKGLRVLAFALKEKHPKKQGPLIQDDINHLTFVGFLGLKDALRLEAKEATRRAMEAGIRVVMITGDHRITAEAIAKEANIFKTGDKTLTGKELDELSDTSLKERLKDTSVFARVTPEHKFRIIKAYKARGEIIAMTGDGVNDAPSLVAADLGVAMGKAGTEVAKEASDIILLDDNFGSIVSAVEEGRNIYKTIRKVVLYLLSTSVGELLAISGAILLGFPLPLLPAQIIWLNLITDGPYTIALAMEPREKGLLRGNFKKPKKYIVDSLMTQRIIIMAIMMMAGTLVLFQNYFPTDLAKAWTVSLTALAVFQWFNAWNCRSENKSIFRMNPFKNKFMVLATVVAIALQILAVYNSLFQKFLHTVPLDLFDWLIIIMWSSSIIIVEEIRKFVSWRVKKYWSLLVPPLRAKVISR